MVDTHGHKQTDIEREEANKDAAKAEAGEQYHRDIDRRTLKWNAITAIATVILVVVGIGGIIAAIKTLRVIKRQTDAIEKQTALMGRQWVDYGEWSSFGFNAGNGPKLRINFVIVNKTNYPLVLPDASVKFFVERPGESGYTAFVFRENCQLLPNKGPVDHVDLNISQSELDLWAVGHGSLRIRIEGDLSFIGTNPVPQEQNFYGILTCRSLTETRFEEETRHQEHPN